MDKNFPLNASAYHQIDNIFRERRKMIGQNVRAKFISRIQELSKKENNEREEKQIEKKQTNENRYVIDLEDSEPENNDINHVSEQGKGQKVDFESLFKLINPNIKKDKQTLESEQIILEEIQKKLDHNRKNNNKNENYQKNPSKTTSNGLPSTKSTFPKVSMINNLLKLSQILKPNQTLQYILYQANLLGILPMRFFLYYCIEYTIYQIHKKLTQAEVKILKMKKVDLFLNEIEKILAYIIGQFRITEKPLIIRMIKALFCRFEIQMNFSEKIANAMIGRMIPHLKKYNITEQQFEKKPGSTIISSDIFSNIPLGYPLAVVRQKALELEDLTKSVDSIDDPQKFTSNCKLFYCQSGFSQKNVLENFSDPVSVSVTEKILDQVHKEHKNRKKSMQNQRQLMEQKNGISMKEEEKQRKFVIKLKPLSKQMLFKLYSSAEKSEIIAETQQQKTSPKIMKPTENQQNNHKNHSTIEILSPSKIHKTQYNQKTPLTEQQQARIKQIFETYLFSNIPMIVQLIRKQLSPKQCEERIQIEMGNPFPRKKVKGYEQNEQQKQKHKKRQKERYQEMEIERQKEKENYKIEREAEKICKDAGKVEIDAIVKKIEQRARKLEKMGKLNQKEILNEIITLVEKMEVSSRIKESAIGKWVKYRKHK